MEPRTIEGIREEVERFAGELAGRRVRVIVLDDPGPPRRSHGAPDGGEVSSPPANPIVGVFRC